jgi:hypothetical protein
MEKIVHFFEIFKTIFYFKLLEPREIIFGSVNVWKKLNVLNNLNLEMV